MELLTRGNEKQEAINLLIWTSSSIRRGVFIKGWKYSFV